MKDYITPEERLNFKKKGSLFLDLLFSAFFTVLFYCLAYQASI
jgi:hypothetical protein